MNNSAGKLAPTYAGGDTRPHRPLGGVVALVDRRADTAGASRRLDIDPTDAEMMREWLLEIKDLTTRIETVLDASQRGKR